MNNLLPVSWKHSLDDLRGKVLDAFDRWTPAQRKSGEQEERDYWPAPLAWSGLPAVDFKETDDAFHVTAEVPGLSEKDINIELTGKRLILRGEKKDTREEKRGAYCYTECSYGSFQRAIPLPCEIDADNIQATCRHGVLRLRLPKAESDRARRIQVHVH